MANPRRSNNVNQVPTTEEKKDQDQKPNTNESTVSGISGMAAIEMPAVAITVDVLRSSATEEKKDPRLVAMIVEYPENFKGKKYMNDGQLINVSPESAERFETLGIAKRVEE